MEEIIQTTIETTIEKVIQYSNLFCFDWATLILSGIAIIISIWSAIWTVHRNNKSSYKNNLYEEVLKKALQKELPSLMQRSIDINSKTTNDIEINKFEEFLMCLRKDILVFKYTDNKFFEKIEKTILKIDDNVVLISTRKENFEKRYAELVKEIKKLYKYTEKYLFK